MSTRLVLIKVAGVTFEGRQEKIALLHGGERVELVAEPDNAYDANAIAVMVLCDGAFTKVGYVPREMTKDFAALPDDAEVTGKVFEVTGGFVKFDGSTASRGLIVEVSIPDDEWQG